MILQGWLTRLNAAWETILVRPYLRQAMYGKFARVAKEVDRKSARGDLARFEKLPPGAIIVALWFIGMVLFLSLVMTLQVVASVLAGLYAGG